MKQRFIIGILIVAFSYWAIRAIVAPGFFPMHDDTQVARVVAMGRALRNGQLPVRWVSDLGYGYGYPLFNFYGPLPYYAGGFFYAVGLTGLAAAKIMIIGGIILSAFTFFIAFKSILGVAGALLGSVLYTYAPYHAVDIYVRGAVGEFWAMVFLPLLVGGILHFSHAGQERKGYFMAIIGLSGVILSHTILGYVTTLFYVFCLGITYFFRVIRRTFHIRRNEIGVFVVSLSLTAFFWIPAIFESKYTSVAGQVSSSSDYKDHFVCIGQLWNSVWGYGGSAPGCIDGMSFIIGKYHIFIAVLGLLLWGIKKKLGDKYRRVITFSLIITAGSLFFMTSWSAGIWSIVPLFSYIQFPWRFLAFTTLGVSLLGAMVSVMFSNRIYRWGISIFLIILIISLNMKWFVPLTTIQRNIKEYESQEELRFRASRISDEYLPPLVPRPKDVGDIVRGTLSPSSSLKIDTERDTETYAKFMITSSLNQEITLKRAYFPGWRYLVDGKVTVPRLESGLPRLTITEGAHVIEIRLQNTPVRVVANLITILTLFGLLIVYGKKTIA